MSGNATRQHIVEAADRLFYQQGFSATSFADIASAVKLSRGNFYYHFKTKDEILDAVIGLREEKTRRMLADWEAEGGTPIERIRCFIRILIMNRADIMLYGCPVGTLSNELAKLDSIARHKAGELFGLYRDWLEGQFEALGRVSDADGLAMHLLMRSQGVATLANAFRDESYIGHEVDDMCTWLDTQLASGPQQS